MNTIFTDLEIEAAALRQRTSIEEELLKLRLKRRVAAALFDFPGDAAVVFKPESSSASSNTRSSVPQQALPTRVSISPAAGRIASICSMTHVKNDARGETERDGTEARPAITPAEHNAFPRGRWS